ncbi:hypothetical protein SCHPADRAFT_155378 [Schizopora paradoxa]|uniref:Secreted protein n=1 Tax=Schizopora paradoxa TaxID=27342 RepID=A0A0H2S0Y1_9AGAM|nr:hypothetical protein SCHPADRAFT_155378 [Schizopora paradoxa]
MLVPWHPGIRVGATRCSLVLILSWTFESAVCGKLEDRFLHDNQIHYLQSSALQCSLTQAKVYPNRTVMPVTQRHSRRITTVHVTLSSCSWVYRTSTQCTLIEGTRCKLQYVVCESIK